MPAPAHFTVEIAEHFCASRDYYGDIDISPDLFASYIWNIACKHVKDAAEEPEIIEFARKLCLRDLYLVCGCVHKSEKAWETFDLRYRRFITDLVRFCYRHGTDNEEIADLVLISLYFDDRSGRQRIASYDGRSSLATWLRVIVINRAINERSENKVTDEDSVANIPDARASINFEYALRAERYGKILCESIVHALRQLTATERVVLLWRYEDNMQLGEIAHLLGIHQSNVTRRLLRLQARLRESVIQTLASQYLLSSAAIQECLADVADNPMISVSLLNLMKEAQKPVAVALENRQPPLSTDHLPRAAGNR
jgi:RNA polymerase sigma-70 factor